MVKEGWLTMYKSRKPTFFSSRPVPDKLVDRAWAALHQFSNKGPLICFYQVTCMWASGRGRGREGEGEGEGGLTKYTFLWGKISKF